MLDSTNNFLRLNLVQFGDSDTLKYFIYQGTNTNALQKNAIYNSHPLNKSIQQNELKKALNI